MQPTPAPGSKKLGPGKMLGLAAVVLGGVLALLCVCGFAAESFGLVDDSSSPTPSTVATSMVRTGAAPVVAETPRAASRTSPAPTSLTPSAPASSPASAPAVAPTVARSPAKAAPPRAAPSAAAPAGGQGSCAEGYYRNVDGNCVHRPVQAPQAPAGASAQCQDGTYSFSQHRQGTCSHHGGVKTWL